MPGTFGDVLYGLNVDFSGTTPISGNINLNGELLVGATVSPFIRPYVPTGSGGIVVNKGPGTIDFALSNIPNSSLQNSNFTITAGTNLSGGGTAPLGGSVSLSLNSQIQQPNGTVSAPSYSFSSDPTSGMYFTAGVIRFSVGSTDALTFGTSSASFNSNDQFFQTGHFGGGLIVNINIQAANYNVQNFDYFIGFDTVTTTYTLTLKLAPNTGQYYIVKDVTGHAATNNITISGNGKNIDGAANYVIAINFGSVGIIYDGTRWNIV
jgi:hypothetical protein